MELGSRIRDPEKTYSESWIQGSKRPCIQCIKLASAGDRTRVACVTSRHSTSRAIRTAYTVSSGCYSADRQGGVKSPPPQNLPQPVEFSITIQHNSMGLTQHYGPWILLIYIYIKLPIDH